MEGDTKCKEIRDELVREGVDFKKLFGKANASHAGRSWVMDSVIIDSVAQRKGRRVVIIGLGEGLETQRFRMQDQLPVGSLWFSVDVPDCLQTRERFIRPDEAHFHVAISATETQAWISEIMTRAPHAREAQVIVVAGGLFMYLTEENVRDILRALIEAFPHGTATFDFIGTSLSKRTMSEKGWHLTQSYVTPRMPFGIDYKKVVPALKRWLGDDVQVEYLPYRLPITSFMWLIFAILQWTWLRRFLPTHMWKIKWETTF